MILEINLVIFQKSPVHNFIDHVLLLGNHRGYTGCKKVSK